MQVVLNQCFTIKNLIFCVLVVMVASCGPSKLQTADATTTSKIAEEPTENYFKGLLVVDPAKNDTIVELNSTKYFTPASNVKIFTLYSGMMLLSDQLPSLKYLERNDTLYVEGTGDPTWLHPFFQDSSAIEFLNRRQNIALYHDNYAGTKYQPGWAWEDFDTYFSPEISPIPLFGNVITVTQKDSIEVSPSIFKEETFRGKHKKRRTENRNQFFVPYTTDTLQIPYITSKELTKQLLEIELNRKITVIDSFPQGEKQTRLGIASDSLFKRMMYESDNFLAEQIMLMASSQLSDTLSFSISKNHMLENHLKNLKQQPRWVDGSGLSRYNLFTPEAMVQVLHQLYREVPEKRLFSLFPYWDESGTLDHIGETSFIRAKSGSLGNNYNLSGYLFTKSEKTLIFSIMNNHFRAPTEQIRLDIMETLKRIHDSY